MDMQNLHPMHDFSVQHLRFKCRAETPIGFDSQPGKAIRGALYHALIETFSPNDPVPGIPLDPIRKFLAGQDQEHARGQDLPRAFSVEPPAANTQLAAGETFEFGVSLMGTGQDLMPHLMRAMQQAGGRGVGMGRGRFRLMQIDEINPLDDSRRLLLQQNRLENPRLAVTHARIIEEARLREGEPVVVRFISPMRLISGGALVKKPLMGVLLRRLLERAQTLVEVESRETAYQAPQETWKAVWQQMGEIGDQLDQGHLNYDRTRWVDVDSYSHHRQRTTPIGGFIGEACWGQVPLPVLVWLLWGQSLHVGKNAVKGDGYFRVK